MPLSIDAAKQAGQIASQIELCDTRLAEIAKAKSENWQISKFSAVSPDGLEVQLMHDRNSNLNVETSQLALDFAAQVYTAEKAELEQQLAGLGD